MHLVNSNRPAFALQAVQHVHHVTDQHIWNMENIIFSAIFQNFQKTDIPTRQPGPTDPGDYQGKWKVMAYQEKQKSAANTGEIDKVRT